MGKYNLIFKKNWFAKSIFGTVGIFVVLDQLARYQYNIPEFRDPNLTMWPWWLEKVAAKRYAKMGATDGEDTCVEC
ncbi:hypothetical protein AK88_04400 [Plasmodium fragile]|uniref:Uncharacterized protein n=1 Tax=Plasmodium fragile TaxID=5857 RepID=A0A0D9QJS9_PLAFR|nr:uncharacterized protein AK88_04400 [Plasmodium fragile]KJP85991.1 hypothetical protein AK88_04400 [Plasmodium fragile]